MLTGDPNPLGALGALGVGFPHWSPATTGNFSAQNLGSPGTAAIGACNTQFWGTSSVPYDYQIFGIQRFLFSEATVQYPALWVVISFHHLFYYLDRIIRVIFLWFYGVNMSENTRA